MSTQPPGAALRNIASLRKFNLYTSLALTVVSSLIFMDLLMLRMDIDTRLFGSIKSMLYLLPAIAYQCMTPVLNRVRNDAKVCAWCYLLRCFIPSILPLLALVTANHTVLTVACFLLPSVGMMLAGFANNTLMILYKRFIPEHDFNRQVGIMNMLLSLPACLTILIAAKIFDWAGNSSNTVFFITYFLVTLATIAFELPAFFAVSKMSPAPVRNNSSFSWREMLTPYSDRKYLHILILTIMKAMTGGMLSAYLVVYMLQERSYTISTITMLTTGICLLGEAVSPSVGKLTDRIGYARIFLGLASLCLVGCIMLAAGWCRGILLLIFALLSWDLGSGVCGRLLGYALYSAASKMANPNYSSYYVGAFSLCNNGGSFIGSILGGAVYTFFLHRYGGEKLSAVFHGYFCVCLIFMAILTAICFFYWKNQKERQ